MKTHQEIHDAIEFAGSKLMEPSPVQTLFNDRVITILHALNDRIEALEKRLVPDDGSAASDERLRH